MLNVDASEVVRNLKRKRMQHSTQHLMQSSNSRAERIMMKNTLARWLCLEVNRTFDGEGFIVSRSRLAQFLAWARDINSINDRQNNPKTFLDGRNLKLANIYSTINNDPIPRLTGELYDNKKLVVITIKAPAFGANLHFRRQSTR